MIYFDHLPLKPSIGKRRKLSYTPNILAVHEDKLRSAEINLSELNNITRKYLLFLKFSLNFFNSFNVFFQSRKILVHKLKIEII